MIDRNPLWRQAANRRIYYSLYKDVWESETMPEVNFESGTVQVDETQEDSRR